MVDGDDGLLHSVVSGPSPDVAALGVCLRIAWRSPILGGHRGTDLLHLRERILLAECGSRSLFATCTLLAFDQGAASLHPELAVVLLRCAICTSARTRLYICRPTYVE